MSEDQIQAKIYQDAYNTYPEIRKCFFSVPNGGTRNKIEAMKMKATGLTAGIPDMILLYKGKCYGIEVKTETGSLSPAQITVHEAWRKQGVDVFVVRSAKEGLEVVKNVIKGEI